MNEDVFSVSWSSDALEDRGKIYDDLFEWSCEKVAEKTDEEVTKSVGMLAFFPEIGVEKRGRKGRQLILTSVPYIVSYAIDEKSKTVKILRVLHQKAIKK